MLVAIMLLWQQVLSAERSLRPGTALSSSFNPPNHPIPMSQMRKLRLIETKGLIQDDVASKCGVGNLTLRSEGCYLGKCLLCQCYRKCLPVAGVGGGSGEQSDLSHLLTTGLREGSAR